MATDRKQLLSAIEAELEKLDASALNTAYALLGAVNQDENRGELRELAATGHLEQVPAWLSEHGWLRTDFELGPVARFMLGKAAEPIPLTETARMILSYLGQ